MEGRFLSGEAQIKKQLEEVILNSLREKGVALKEALSPVDLVSRFRSFSVLGIIFAGLVDGFNPCAFTVIVFFISFLSFQKYSKRNILVTGLCFIFAVFLTYLLIGLGLFRMLYSLRVFYFLFRLFYILIACLAFLLGIFTVYDILKFKATQKAEDMFLKLPVRLKYYIHYIIGLKYRQVDKNAQSNKRIFQLIITAFAVGSIVSVVELVCTGQLYLPTIGFVLKISPLRLQALTYLIIYNIMFVIPLLLVFFFALAGVGSGEFSKFTQKHMILIKALMAVLFFGLGLILIWKV
jgi:cytochrome c biogenesis protein CcdA